MENTQQAFLDTGSSVNALRVTAHPALDVAGDSSLQQAAGLLDDAPGLLAARATVGVMLKRVELYAGYDHAAVYGPSHETLSGPLLGARAWF